MKFVLDTNIIIHAGRSLDFQAYLDKRFDLFNPVNQLIVPIVVKGELLAGSPPFLLGAKRRSRQENFLANTIELNLNQQTVLKYAEIDLFSRGKHPKKVLNTSAIKMGKNDLWIAATAVVEKAELITTDKDFRHLSGEFLTVHYVDSDAVLNK